MGTANAQVPPCVAGLPAQQWLRVLSLVGVCDVGSFAACSSQCRALVRSLGRTLAANIAARELLAVVPPCVQTVQPSSLPRQLRVNGPLCLEYKWAGHTELVKRVAAAWRKPVHVGVVFTRPGVSDIPENVPLSGWRAEAVDWKRALNGARGVHAKDSLVETPGSVWGLPRDTPVVLHPTTVELDECGSACIRGIAAECDALAFFGEPAEAEWLAVNYASKSGVIPHPSTFFRDGHWLVSEQQQSNILNIAKTFRRALEDSTGVGLPVAVASCTGYARWTVSEGLALSAFVPSIYQRTGVPTHESIRLAIREAVQMAVWTCYHADGLGFQTSRTSRALDREAGCEQHAPMHRSNSCTVM
eukprot:m51a1_g3450 hypothetical protein (359) ;mRNA; f:679005-680397